MGHKRVCSWLPVHIDRHRNWHFIRHNGCLGCFWVLRVLAIYVSHPLLNLSFLVRHWLHFLLTHWQHSYDDVQASNSQLLLGNHRSDDWSLLGFLLWRGLLLSGLPAREGLPSCCLELPLDSDRLPVGSPLLQKYTSLA